MRLITLLPLVLLACGPVRAPLPLLPTGRLVETPAFETYVTDHNGHSRVRRSYALPTDTTAMRALDSAEPDPAAFRSLIALDQAIYAGHMTAEVVAEVAGPDGPVTRLVRLTVDQTPFENIRNGQLVTASGQFFLRGANYTWVTADDGPILSGQDQRGLTHMVLDFDTQSVSVILRTGVDALSEVRTELVAQDIPLNIVTGAYGGDVAMQVWAPGQVNASSVNGALRGQLGGAPVYGTGLHSMSTSGLYAGEGVDPLTGQRIRFDGLFVGVDPNALP